MCIRDSYNTINNHKRSLKASFYIAIQDDCVRKNPFDFKLSEVLENDTKEKVALTEEQEQALLSFIKTDNVYHKYFDDVPVSYTHLDVYKRQILLMACASVWNKLLSFFSNRIAPVSNRDVLTDVYKRQISDCSEVILHSTIAERTCF